MRRILLSIFVLLCGTSALKAQSQIVTDFKPVCDSLAVLLQERTTVEGKLSLKTVMRRGNALDFYFTESLGDFPWKSGDPKWFKKTLGNLFPENYSKYKVGEIYSRRVDLNKLTTPRISNDGTPADSRHRVKKHHDSPSVVTALDFWGKFDKGLDNKHIALWQSHGRYYEHKLDRWEWQRPCLFQTCEDMFTQSFVLPYLVPMLENAGAYVMLPRERDIQVNEVVVDNDSSWISAPVIDVAGWEGAVRGTGSYSEEGSWEDAGTGFADMKEVYTEVENPFVMGSARKAACIPHNSKEGLITAVWKPEIPKRGEYAVYVSYSSLPNSCTSACYTVRHLGGESSFAVNQKMGGGTWIYLGTFEFAEGSEGYVTLDNKTPEGWRHTPGSVVTADAVRFGGGMGNIARGEVKDTCGTVVMEPYVSGLPRSAEAARYWLQWAGADTTVWHQNEGLGDYRDDFMSRGDWVEWMSRGSAINPSEEGGMGIPFDLSLGFHSDAGVTPNDSLIGTLAIYTLKSENKQKLPSGEDRLTSRQYSSFIQDQIVHDLRSDFDTLWRQRAIWDRGYRESRTPSCPAMLLELLSHQNFADMKYGLDPSFRFTVSRAIYKGMLKYMSSRYGHEYAVQPLPVESVGVAFGKVSEGGNHKVHVSWKPVSDPHEPTAEAKGYVIYTRIDDGAFDTGRVIKETHKTSSGALTFETEIVPGHIYSYRIAAFNDGGISFPSETVSIGCPAVVSGKAHNILVVNNFDRVSGPAFFDTPSYAGFDNSLDSGVPYIRDISYIGRMHENRRVLPWTDDDNPGFGASDQDYAGRSVAGNTFDFTIVHGEAIMKAGYPFYSCSNEAFCADSSFRAGAWAVDLICGKQVTTTVGTGLQQKYTVFPIEMQKALKAYSEQGGNILVSGAYIGTDISDCIFPVKKDSVFTVNSVRFAKEVLGYKWMSGQASRKAVVKAARNQLVDFSEMKAFGFCNEINPDQYCVESPDGIVPASDKGSTILRYADTGISAGVAFEGKGYRTVCIGFPIETLLEDEDIDSIIHITLDFFKK